MLPSSAPALPHGAEYFRLHREGCLHCELGCTAISLFSSLFCTFHMSNTFPFHFLTSSFIQGILELALYYLLSLKCNSLYLGSSMSWNDRLHTMAVERKSTCPCFYPFAFSTILDSFLFTPFLLILSCTITDKKAQLVSFPLLLSNNEPFTRLG